MKQINAPAGTQAVLRALRLLKRFTPQEPNLSLGELSSALELTKTTTHRLLAALESEGLVARDAMRNTYRLGPTVIALGSQALLTSDLRAATRPTLEALAFESRETTTLEVLVGDQILVFDGVAGLHRVAASLDIGTRWPAHATSTGKCFLAHATNSTRDQLLRPPLTRFTDNTLHLDGLHDSLDSVKKLGYAVAREELELGYVAVAAEFRGPMGDVEGALSIGGPVSRFTPEKVSSLGERLRAAADELTTRRQES